MKKSDHITNLNIVQDQLYLHGKEAALEKLKAMNPHIIEPYWAIKKYGIKRVKRMGEIALKGGGIDNSHRIATPPEFMALLIKIAETAGAPILERKYDD